MAKKDKVWTRWNREFRLVRHGLDQEQVTEFGDELMARLKEAQEKAENPSYPSSLDKLAEQTLLEAEKLAEKLKDEATQIRTQAEADAASIAAEAQRIAEEKVESIGRVAKAAAEEGQKVVQTAEQKSAMIEAETKRQAEWLLDHTKRQIESKIRRDIKGALEQLSPYVDDIMKEVEALRIDLENWDLTTPAKSSPLPEAAATSPTPPVAQVEQPPSPAGHDADDSPLCEGTLRVFLQGPVHPEGLGEICQRLAALPSVSLQDTRKEADGSFDITVSLRYPTPLVKILNQLEDVAEVSVERPGTPRGVGDGREGAQGVERQDAAAGTRILVKLKD